jgi:hypothetical protein
LGGVVPDTACVPARAPLQMLWHSVCTDRGMVMCAGSGRWSEVESKALVAYVKGKLAEGISDRSISWIEASKHIKTRNADQCRLHWRSVATGRGYSGKEGGDAAGGGVGGSGKVDWVWKRDRSALKTPSPSGILWGWFHLLYALSHRNRKRRSREHARLFLRTMHWNEPLGSHPLGL